MAIIARLDPDAQDLRTFWTLAAELHRGGQWANLWIKTSKYKRTFWFRAGTRPTLHPALLRDSNVYFGVHPLTTAGSLNQRSTIQTVAALNCLFAEFDAKDFTGGKPAILAHLRGLAAFPSVTIDSGGGYHCYWLFDQPLTIASEEMRQFARRLQSAWVDFTGGDKAAKDLARVLRVPGTLNHKYTPAGAVRLVGMDLERRYSAPELLGLCFDAFNALCLEDEPRRADTVPDTERVQPLDASDREILDALQKNQRAARLWAGDTSMHHGDQNRADLSLCNWLAFYTGRDRARVDRLFRQSALYRADKWDTVHFTDGRTYGERTIAMAIRWTRECWQPPDPARAEALEAARAAVGSNMTQLDRAAAIQAMRAAVQQGVQQ